MDLKKVAFVHVIGSGLALAPILYSREHFRTSGFHREKRLGTTAYCALKSKKMNLTNAQTRRLQRQKSNLRIRMAA
jgi:hypothetical protein